MTIHLCTFSDESMSRARALCVDSAMRNGVDSVYAVEHEDFRETIFHRQYAALLSQSRGLGFWAWKPCIIDDQMKTEAHDGDMIIYSDAGVEFIAPVSHIIERMDREDQDIFLFGNNWEHAHWCKRDVVNSVWQQGSRRLSNRGPLTDLLDYYVDGGASWAMFGKQVQASVIFFRVSDYTRSFVAEWLKWCLFEGGRLIDDSPSRLPNHEQFREHRHDQSILTTLAYREGLSLHWWPAQYNRFVPGGPVFTYEKGEYQDDYPPLFHHHRLRNDQWPSP